jgi:hypothetical protein
MLPSHAPTYKHKIDAYSCFLSFLHTVVLMYKQHAIVFGKHLSAYNIDVSVLFFVMVIFVGFESLAIVQVNGETMGNAYRTHAYIRFFTHIHTDVIRSSPRI